MVGTSLHDGQPHDQDVTLMRQPRKPALAGVSRGLGASKPLVHAGRTIHDVDVEPAFLLHLPPDTARLSFGQPYDAYGDGYILNFDVELTDDGLTATTTATVAAFDTMQLDAFLQALANDWRGWEGTRSWRSLEGELLLDATHDGIRRVELQVTVRPRQTHTAPSWAAHCHFRLEPGAQLATIADDIATLLGPSESRYGK